MRFSFNFAFQMASEHNRRVKLNQTTSHMGIMHGEICQVNKQMLTNPSKGKGVKSAPGLRFCHHKPALLLKMTVRLTMIIITESIEKKRATSIAKESRMIVCVHVQQDDDNVSLLLNGAKTDHV